MDWTPKMKQHFRNYWRNHQFEAIKMVKLLPEIEKRESKKLSSFQKVLK